MRERGLEMGLEKHFPAGGRRAISSCRGRGGGGSPPRSLCPLCFAQGQGRPLGEWGKERWGQGEGSPWVHVCSTHGWKRIECGRGAELTKHRTNQSAGERGTQGSRAEQAGKNRRKREENQPRQKAEQVEKGQESPQHEHKAAAGIRGLVPGCRDKKQQGCPCHTTQPPPPAP